MTPHRGIALVVALGAAIAAPTGGQQPIVISDVTIIDGTGRAPQRHMNVTIAAGRIAHIAPTSSERSPDGARVVDGRGKFLIPGLWDMHVHLAKAGENALGLFVAHGVTGVRDAGGDFGVVGAWRNEVRTGARLGPRIIAAGPILESPRRVERIRRISPSEPVARFRLAIADSAAAERAVDSLARLGVDFVKFRTVASVQAYRGIAAAARRARLPLAGHGDAVSPDEMIRGGQRSIEHVILPPLQWRDGALRRRFIRYAARNNVAVVPTLVNFHDFMMVRRDRAEAILDDTLGILHPMRRYVSRRLLEDWREQMEDLGGRVSVRRALLRAVYGSVRRDLRALHRAGAKILPATDVAVALMYPGYSLHDELRYFVREIGMTPMAAIVSATRLPAEFLAMSDSLGTVEEGKIADLVLLDANPLVDIANTRRIAAVVSRGRYLDRAALDALLEAAGRHAGH